MKFEGLSEARSLLAIRDYRLLLISNPLMFAGIGGRHFCAGLLTSAGGNTDPKLPPPSLNQGGPYQFTRNPIMIGDLLVLTGATLAAASPLLALYTIACFYAIDRYLRDVEEAELRELFGAAYEEYAARVPRWLPSP